MSEDISTYTIEAVEPRVHLVLTTTREEETTRHVFMLGKDNAIELINRLQDALGLKESFRGS